MNGLELAILRSVTYAALFDYPLTLEQLHETLIEATATRMDVLDAYDRSEGLQAVVSYRDGFFFPVGRDALVPERRRREGRSRVFLARHRRLLRLICAMPFTRLVALSGSIAHLNLEPGGDLDLFVITRGCRVWTVTLWMVLLTKLLGVRRVVCANFVMADSNLALVQRDLFTANQILHLKALIGEESLGRFVAANPFVAEFYPNAVRHPSPFALDRRPTLDWTKRWLEFALAPFGPAIEWLCSRVYGWHLQRRAASWRSPDQVSLRADCLKLHTQSHRECVMARFDRAVDDAMRRAERTAAPPAAAGGRR